MFPFVASQAIALAHAKQKSVKAAQRSTDADPPIQTVRRGFFRRFLDILVESRRRRADLEIERHRHWIGVDGREGSGQEW
jgi:hypothetical protein